MKFYSLTILFVIGFGFSCVSQSLDQFFEGAYAPPELNLESSERMGQLYKKYLERNNLQDEEKYYEEFTFNYNYFLDRLNRSGDLFYNDQISAYLNTLKDEILFDRPEKDEISVYLTSFTELNAFTNDFGNIYVNIGTVAKANNEMELLFILAHEISHVLLNHSIKLETIQIDEDEIENKEVRDKSIVLDRHYHSRKYELQADSLAYFLMKNVGVSSEHIEETMKNLKVSYNPILSAPVNYSLLTFDVPSSNSFVKSVFDGTGRSLNDYYSLDFVSKDSVESGTHPSIDDRIKQLAEFESIVSDSRKTESTTFLINRDLALRVCAHSYTLEGEYIKGLYTILQLRAEAPADSWLIKLQFKLMLLISQDKYEFDPFEGILNPYLDACDDIPFLRFRETILSLTALDFNLISRLAIGEFLLKNENHESYIEEILSYTDQFLYKFNARIFKGNQGKITFNASYDYIESEAFERETLLTQDEKKQRSNLEEKGFRFLETQYRDSSLSLSFINGFSDYEVLNNHVKNYKVRRNSMESCLELESYLIPSNIRVAAAAYKKGQFSVLSEIPEEARIALVVSDVIHLDGAQFDYQFSPKKTVEFDQRFRDVLNNYETFDLSYSNRPIGGQSITISDNYYHRLFRAFYRESWELKDLAYNSVDEELKAFKSKEKVRYIGFNLLLSNQILENRNYHVLYFILVDLEKMNAIYIAKIGKRSEPKESRLSNELKKILDAIKD